MLMIANNDITVSVVKTEKDLDLLIQNLNKPKKKNC